MILFGVGLFVWSFLEYAVHRWLFHGLLWRVHRAHHKKPVRLNTVNVPLSFSAPVSLLLGAASWATGVLPAFLGLLLGYVLFEVFHFFIHATRWTWLRNARRHHSRHHSVDDATGYGVTSPVWDVILGTATYAPHPFAVCPSPGDDTDDSETL